MSRAAEVAASIPLANRFIIGLCVAVFLLQTILNLDLQDFTLCPRNVIYDHEYYRIFTSCVFHGGLIHIGFNMMSTAAIGSLLEKRFGTLRHIFSVFLGMFLTSSTYILVACLLSWVCRYDKLMYQHSVGFSGVLFQLSVLEANLSPNSTRSVFGMLQVPAYLYPWALLVALQIFMPQISFVGHLSGIFVGTLQLYGVLDALILPSDEYLRAMDEWPSLQRIAAREGYVRTPADGSSSTSHVRDPSALLSGIRRSLGMVIKLVKDLLETIRVVVFGRGRDGNENIRFGLSGGHGSDEEDTSRDALIDNSDIADGDDDDWAGLPSVSPPSSEVESRIV